MSSSAGGAPDEGAAAERGGAARTILFTGKGGVGKTTVAAATALRCADAGLRTVVLSTDTAHSLGDALGVRLGSVAKPVTDNLWAQELDAQERFEDVWADVQAWLVEVLDWAGVHGVEAEELALLPGLDEVFALGDIRDYAVGGGWDVVVVDCAPTAETIRLLSLPDVLSWWMARAFPAGRTLSRAVRPLLARVTSLPVASDEVWGAGQQLYDRLSAAKQLLTEGERSSVRLVVNPEKLVVAEARRTHTYLSLFGYRVDAVVVNRLLPDAVTDPWFKAWKEAHAEHLDEIEDGFAPLPVLRSELAPDEPVGVDRLRALAAELYEELDAAAVLHEGVPLSVEEGDGGERVLSLALPSAERDDIEVGEADGELLVRVGPYRRAIALPDSLRRRDVLGARFDGDRLLVRFAPRAAEANGGES